MMRIGTKVCHAGLARAAQGEPFLAGVTFAGPYYVSGDPSTIRYTYGRDHNPTWTQFERALSELEGGSAVSFASGMAAVAAVFGTTLRPDDVLVMPSDGYYTGRLLADGFFAAERSSDTESSHCRQRIEPASGDSKTTLA